VETLTIVSREGDSLVLVPTVHDTKGRDSAVTAFAAADAAAQLIERSDSHVITVTVSKRRPLSILERFVLRATSLQAEARGKAVWLR
jgi:hypothetical protein